MSAATDWKCSSNSSEWNLKRPLKRESGQTDTVCSLICVTHTYLRVLSRRAPCLSTDGEVPAACSLRSRRTSRGRLTRRGEKGQPYPLLQPLSQRCSWFIIKMLFALVFKRWGLCEKACSTLSPSHLSTAFSAVTSLSLSCIHTLPHF